MTSSTPLTVTVNGTPSTFNSSRRLGDPEAKINPGNADTPPLEKTPPPPRPRCHNYPTVSSHHRRRRPASLKEAGRCRRSRGGSAAGPRGGLGGASPPPTYSTMSGSASVMTRPCEASAARRNLGRLKRC